MRIVTTLKDPTTALVSLDIREMDGTVKVTNTLKSSGPFGEWRKVSWQSYVVMVGVELEVIIRQLLPTMHCRSEHCWELLHPFAHHCQHAGNNSQVLKNNIERTNHFAIKTLLNLGNSATYDFCLAMADMDKLERRRTLQSLILFFKCFKLDGPNYIPSAN